MSRWMGAVLVGIMVSAATLGRPAPAAASDNLEYIIPAAVGGVVAVVAIVAIVMADRTEPEYELVDWHLQSLDERRDGVRLAHQCAPGALGRPLLCW